MNGFSIGITTLAAGRRGLDVVGQNIANAATPGYHRQAAYLVNQVSTDGKTGLGVDVASITRYDAPAVRTAILHANAAMGYADARVTVQRQAEGSLGTGPGTVPDSLEGFFNQLEQLTSRPDNLALRRTLLGSASALAGRFSSVAGDLDRVRADLRGQAAQSVAEVNEFARQIAELNAKIAMAEGSGTQANDLKDQRGRLIDQLSQRMDIQTVDQPLGQINVIATGATVVVGEAFANKFQVGPDAGGNLVLTQSGSAQPIALKTGSLGGLLQAYNQDIPATRTRLDGLARELIARVNAAHATGLTSAGPLASALGTTAVFDPTGPLATQNLPIPVQAGQLTISVTDTVSGQRTNVAVAIDPATQGLNDVAAAITAATGGQVQATVDPAGNRLKFQAQAGFAFDFAGRDTNPPGGGAVADPDTARLLPALGVNGFFSGTDAVSIAVRPELLADPSLLAAGRTGQPGDATNLERMAAVRDQAAVGGRTLGAEYADLAATLGAQVNELSDVQDAQAGVLQQLSAQEQAVTGVDVNEELIHLLDFQRMVEAGTKYLSIVNASLDAIMEMVR